MLTSNGLFKETSIIFVIEILVRIIGTYIFLNIIGLYGLPVASIIGSFTTIIFLSFILINKSGITFREILLAFNAYEVFIFVAGILLGYLIAYPNDIVEALSLLIISLLPFIILTLLGKRLRLFLIGT